MSPTSILLAFLTIFSLNPALGQKNEQPAYTFGVRIVGHGKPMVLIPGYKGSPDTYDLTNDVARIQTPILVLGSWVSWDYPSKEAGMKDYQRAWAKAHNTAIVFSDHGKRFLMYEDLAWLISQMEAFLRQSVN